MLLELTLTLCLSQMNEPDPARNHQDPLPPERSLLDGNRPGGKGWYTVLDGVMGGRSTGSFRITETGLLFEGVLNTNGGGFASIRRSATDLELGQPGERGLKLRVRGDGRRYTLRLRQPTGRRGFAASYRATFATAKNNEWVDAFVPYSDLVPTWRGRTLDLPGVDPEEVDEIGISIDDGIDGPFEIEVSKVGTFGAFDPEQHLSTQPALVVLCPDPASPFLAEQLSLLREKPDSIAALGATLVVAHSRGGMAGSRPLDAEDAGKLYAVLGPEWKESEFMIIMRDASGRILDSRKEPTCPSKMGQGDLSDV